MAREIRVEGVWRREPEIRLYVLALLELVRQLEARERAAETPAARSGDEQGVGHD
jgi:hypothetical protein